MDIHEVMEWTWRAWLFIVGLSVGSFLNVVIARVPVGESVVRPRSKCPRCGHQITWIENIPVFSWLFLRGRCRGCGQPISIRYLVVEVLTGLVFVACKERFGWSLELFTAVCLVGFLIPLTFIDAEHWILPFELTLPGIAVGLVLGGVAGWGPFQASLYGALIAFCLFRAMEYFGWLAFRKEALGAGDKFLFALLGAFLTYRSLLALVFLSSAQGAIFGVARLAFTGRAGPATPPAAPPAVPVDPNAPAAPAPGAEAAAPPGPEEPPLTMTWDFLRPGLSFGRRLVLLPWSIFLQPIPDEPVDAGGTPVEWQPGVTNLPFGPWLALAGLEVLLVGPWVARLGWPSLALLFGGGGL